MSEQGYKFGITEETRSTSRVDFPLTPDNWKFLAVLKKVYAEMAKNKDGDEYPVLCFELASPDGRFEHIERISGVKEGSDNPEGSMNVINYKIKHVWETYAPFPEKGLGQKAKDFEEYFNIMADGFNAVKKEGDPTMYQDVIVWFAPTYYNNYITFPAATNFLERADVDDKGKPKSEPRRLEFNPRKNTYSMKEAPKASSYGAGGSDIPDMPVGAPSAGGFPEA